jgi:hypothetical protein
MALDTKNSKPFGSIIAWAAMISLPMTVYWGSKELRKPSTKLNKILAGFLKLIIILGILWLLISFLLAGNLSFTFSVKESFQGEQVAMKCFWYLSYGIGVGTIAIISTYWTSLFFKKNKTEAKC